MAKQYLEPPIRYLHNSDSTYLLCTHLLREEKEGSLPLLDVVVVDLTKKQLAFQQKVEGEVIWQDRYLLKIIPARGILEENGAYLFDVSARKRLPLNSAME